MPVIPALRSLRQEVQEFGASQGYIARPYLKKQNNNNNNTHTHKGRNSYKTM
jgi:hypothetical protein